MVAQVKEQIIADKRFQKYIKRHEKYVLPKIQKQVPIPLDSCKIFYFFELDNYYRNDSMFLEDYLFPNFEKHKPVKGFMGKPWLAYIETIIYYPKLNKGYWHIIYDNPEVLTFTKEENFPLDSILILFMLKYNLKYGYMYPLGERFVSYNNNAWISDNNKMILYNEYLTNNWYKLSKGHNYRVFIQSKIPGYRKKFFFHRCL